MTTLSFLRFENRQQLKWYPNQSTLELDLGEVGGGSGSKRDSGVRRDERGAGSGGRKNEAVFDSPRKEGGDKGPPLPPLIPPPTLQPLPHHPPSSYTSRPSGGGGGGGGGGGEKPTIETSDRYKYIPTLQDRVGRVEPPISSPQPPPSRALSSPIFNPIPASTAGVVHQQLLPPPPPPLPAAAAAAAVVPVPLLG